MASQAEIQKLKKTLDEEKAMLAHVRGNLKLVIDEKLAQDLAKRQDLEELETFRKRSKVTTTTGDNK